MIVFDSDDFGCNHVISDMCQTHDCRDALEHFKEVNPLFKATLFAVPGEMTPELLIWGAKNSEWIELAIHGVFHGSNYECEKMSYHEFDSWMRPLMAQIEQGTYAKGFKAPGWQISDDIYKWLLNNGFWVADQNYNDERRPKKLPAYVNNNGEFRAYINGIPCDIVQASHHHTWNCMGNGVYEQTDYIVNLIKDETEFRFVSEVINEANYNQIRARDNG